MKRSSLTTKSPISLRTTCTSSISLWLYLQGAQPHECSFQAARCFRAACGLCIGGMRKQTVSAARWWCPRVQELEMRSSVLAGHHMLGWDLLTN